MHKNILLTGLPRSGTTLSCNLLNELPNTVALHEPMEVSAFPSFQRPNGIRAHIGAFFEESRESLLKNGRVVSKHRKGEVPTNPFGGRRFLGGKRAERTARGSIRIKKALDPDFLLVIKHPAALTALIEDLREEFLICATVRNPLSILCSWSSVDVPISTGHAPAAEGLDPVLRGELAAIPSVLGRQIHLLCWFFERYARLLPEDHVIRYEDLVESGGKALSVITARARELSKPLESRNSNKLYDPEIKQRAGAALLALDAQAAPWKYYERSAVEQLLSTD